MKREINHNNDNILDYLYFFKNISRSKCEFNEVDYAMLSVLSYAEFEKLDPSDKGKRLYSLFPKLAKKNINELEEEDQNVRIVTEKMCSSKRFGSLTFEDFYSKKSDKKEEQYASLVLSSGKRCFLIFRGTDGTLTGWKENAIMLFNDEIPSERHALDTLEKVSKKYDEIVLMGHSKGGLLSSWCGRMCSDSTFSKLKGIYSFDGPGLSKSLSKGERWEKFSTLSMEIIPEKSVVGLLFETQPNVKVVSCKENILTSHFITNWNVDGDHFSYVNDTSIVSKFTDFMVKDFFSSCSENERKIFVDTLFSIVDICDEQNILKLPEVALKKIPELLKAISKIPLDAQQVFWEILGTLQLSAHHGIKKLIRGKKNES